MSKESRKKWYLKNKVKIAQRAKNYKIVARFGVNDHFMKNFVTPAVFKRDGYKCLKCNSKKNIEISHNKYGADITINDLETLCRSCHKKKDNKKKIFIKNIIK